MMAEPRVTAESPVTAETPASRDTEVLVVGGGPAGAAAALVLARSGRRVLLAEQTAGTGERESGRNGGEGGGAGGEGFRIGESIPPAIRPLLRDLGLLEVLSADGHLPCYGNVSIWGRSAPSVTDFLRDPNGQGWHLDRARFDESLRRAAEDAGATVLSAVRWTGAVREQGSGGWRVTFAAPGTGDQERRCDWLVDATGRRSTVARHAGAVRLRDDLLVAFYTRFRSTSGTDRDLRTAVESAPDGWWYTALVPSGERIVAFLTDSDLVDPAALLSAAGFAERLESSQYVRSWLREHRCEPVSAPRGADAGTARLDRVSGDGWTAVGDAAVSFDPLSSQGIFTALFTGLRAGQAIDRALAGSAAELAAYADRLQEIERAYLHHRRLYYAAEDRWPDRPFWQRRQIPDTSPTNSAAPH